MPLAIQKEDIKRANLDRLHYILCPGNEKMLTPGLNRLDVLLQHNRKITCYSWTIKLALADLKENKKISVGYSIKPYFSEWAKSMGLREKEPVDTLRIAAAMLTVWPELDDTLNVTDSSSAHVVFFKEMMTAFYKERNDYETITTKLSELIKTRYGNIYENYRKDLAKETDRVKQDNLSDDAMKMQQRKVNIETIIGEVDQMTNVSLKQRTLLLESIHLLMIKPVFGINTSCIQCAKEMVKFSGMKVLGGFLLGLVGAVLFVASITCALGSFGLLCPISMIGVYLGFHLINGLLGVVGFGMGCLSVQSGLSFFKQGRSDRHFVNKIEQFVTNSQETKEEKRNLDTKGESMQVNYCDVSKYVEEGSFDGSEIGSVQTTVSNEEEIWDQTIPFCSIQ